MPDRDWYAEWLLGEVVSISDVNLYVENDGPDYFAVVAMTTTEAIFRETGDFLVDAIAPIYRQLTHLDPPPQPSLEEALTWARDRHDEAMKGPPVLMIGVLRHAAASDDPRERMMARAVVEAIDV